jgi:glycosyltransferase involved in cell wall biosynthesis
VVIATFNYGRFLRGAIESVLAQTFQDFEIIVVDDGSTDDTTGVLRPFLSDPRIHYFQHEHVGQPRTKNAGIRAATGRLIAFLDADDLWLPTKLEKQVGLFDHDRAARVGVIYTRRLWIDEAGRQIQRGGRTPLRGDVLASLFYRPFICFSSSMVRRAVLDQVGLFDETTQYSIDYDLWLRIALNYQFDFVDEPLVLYRTGHANMSSRLNERIWCVRKIIRRFLDEYGGRDRLDPALVRKVMAEHYCDAAQTAGERRPVYSAGCHLRALTYDPGCASAWKGLGVDWWLSPLKSFARNNRARPSS